MSVTTAKLPVIDIFVKRTIATDAAFVVLAVAMLSIAAQVKVMTVPVPVTLQTLVVLLVGAVLGTVRGVIATASYLAVGAVGLPVFSGAATLAGAIHTVGYLIGFIAAAAIVGLFADAGLLSKVRWTVVAFGLASVVIYAFGVAGLMLSPLQLSLEAALAGGVLPFVWFDAAKAAVAAAALPIAWKLIGR